MKRIFLLSMGLLISVVVGAKGKGATVAHFSHFTYTGEDDYYRENPLTDAAQFYNPILPGWYSDPAICRVGEDYWLVTSTFGYYPGVPLYHSCDLVNWQLVGNILRRPSQLAYLRGQSIDKGGIYAPTIAYNPQNQTYYMITTDVGKGHFYVTTRDPWGEWSDPVFLPHIGGIDPAFFFDDDGQAYIVHKEDTEGQPKWSNHRSIRFIRFNVETGQTYGEDIPLREEGVGPEEQLARDEGPHLYKIRGKYYLICAEGGTSWAHSEVAYKADSVFGPYKRWPRSPMLTQRLRKAGAKYGVSCTGHADLVETPLALSGAVGLKAVCRGLAYDFYYQPAGSDWQLLASDIDVRHVSSSVGGFTGTTIGLYAEHEYTLL